MVIQTSFGSEAILNTYALKVYLRCHAISSTHSTLKELGLSHNKYFGYKELAVIVSMLPCNKSLKRLEVSQANFVSQQYEMFSSVSCNNTNIQTILALNHTVEEIMCYGGYLMSRNCYKNQVIRKRFCNSSVLKILMHHISLTFP